MAAGISAELLTKLAMADYHDTTDGEQFLHHLGSLACHCWRPERVGEFAVRMLTGELQESVLDAEVGVVVVDLDDLTGDPSTGAGPATGHPEAIATPIIQLHIHGELLDDPDNPDAYSVHTDGIMLKSHPWMARPHVRSVLREAIDELDRQDEAGLGVEDPTT